MVNFYDYLYYFIYKFYSFKEKGAVTTSAMIVGALQAINVLSLFMLATIFTFLSKGYLNAVSFIVVLFFFQILTYIRYVYKGKVSIKELEEKWEKKTVAQKKTNSVLRALYIYLSVGIFLGLAIYLGSRAE
jgi:Ca2+/Na+ antiporter